MIRAPQSTPIRSPWCAWGARASRAVAHVPENPHALITVATSAGLLSFRGRPDYLAWLTGGRAPAQVWLTERSTDWAWLVPELDAAGYAVGTSKRNGQYLSLNVYRAGRSLSLDPDDEAQGATWTGRSVAGILDALPREVATADRVRTYHRQLDELDRAIGQAWPGASLGPSIAATAVACLRTHLDAPLGCEWAAAAELRRAGAYGGGRIELYTAGHYDSAQAGDATPWRVDLSGAYPLAMAREPIGAEYDGEAPSDAWREPGTITTALVRVPECLYPPLRVEVAPHVPAFPWGAIWGTWTAAELRAAEACGARVLEVARVRRFRVRSEWQAFGERVRAFRRSAPEGHVRTLAKAIAVQAAGAVASRPSWTRCTTKRPRELGEGVRLDRPGIWLCERFQPSEREVLSSAAFITGTVRAWVALFLHACAIYRVRVVYLHTDGAGTLDDPRLALAWAASHGGAPIEAWKVDRLNRLEVWAPNQRIETRENGREEVAAGGLTGSLTAAELRAATRGAEELRTATAWRSGRRKAIGAWTRAMHLRELAKSEAAALDVLAAESERA